MNNNFKKSIELSILYTVSQCLVKLQKSEESWINNPSIIRLDVFKNDFIRLIALK